MRSRKLRIRWLLALLLPPFLIVGIPVCIAVAAGELFDLEDVIARQEKSSGELLFGPAYGSPDPPYKFARINQRKAEILVIGSSRALDLRREFFNPALSFYNGGRLSTDVWVTRQALERMPVDALPKYLILALDQYDFNAEGTDYHPDMITPEIASREFSETEDRWARLAHIWPTILKDLTRGKIHLPGEGGPKGIGMAAKMQASGFRRDGSYRYGAVVGMAVAQRSSKSRISRCLERIEDSEGPFTHGKSIHKESVEEVGRLLDWCRSRKIQVIGYLPAYAPSVVAEMREKPSRFGFLDGLSVRLSEVFSQRGFQFHDFTTLEGSPDEEFIDGFHPSERVAGKLLLRMAEDNPTAARVIDSARIRSLLQASTDPLVLVP